MDYGKKSKLEFAIYPAPQASYFMETISGDFLVRPYKKKISW